ncbi:heptaprenyl diphosphate synthase component II [Virgibacillus sp. 179-BFC.A HS]|uniref:Heptaprenyl diphosphate synthase component II n=1 Tax=Tigheibacillus jepli TaxID=3035914 RepID=A0ABU5CJN5_9BACI|nr:heptaprenyl diphosphate synthase component II [Virgibacillus sp. 179-BFC.A HS]MDY0405700.1 heptaprenyl diphosphate synthase component II [Virgibacillus sp. 179-BFC.A HS]
MKLGKSYSYLKQDLEKIEKTLDDTIQADHQILHDASTHLLKAGGKRIRPVFVLLSSQFNHADWDCVQTVAVSLELIHMATLVHDDVIDNAALRRGKPTVKQQYDNRVAMYTGDYMLALALENITNIDNPIIHQTLSDALVEVCIGEIEQMKYKYIWDQNLRTYLRRIKRKTALLIATSCKLGALVSGLASKHVNKIYQYGYYIGMSYQIIDDILDFTSNAEELGKPAGNDLRQGNVTLPVLFALQNADFKTKLEKTFADSKTTRIEDMDELISDIKKLGAIQASYRISDLYLKKALQALSGLPDTKAKKTLRNIANYIGKRRF